MAVRQLSNPGFIDSSFKFQRSILECDDSAPDGGDEITDQCSSWHSGYSKVFEIAFHPRGSRAVVP